MPKIDQVEAWGNGTSQIRYLALGDSYTIGADVSETECWPNLLTNALRDRGIKIADPLIIAQTGWTTSELIAGIQQANLEERFDLVSLQVGVNDQYRSKNNTEYRREFRKVLESAITFAHSDPEKVITLSIPDWSVTPFAEGRDRARIAAEIDLFNRENHREAARFGVHYVDVTAESRKMANDPTLITNDGLHPSGKLYSAWTRIILPKALTALGMTI